MNGSKRQRTSRACDYCRLKRIKCVYNLTSSTCVACLENRKLCTFIKPQAKRGPRSNKNEELFDQLQQSSLLPSSMTLDAPMATLGVPNISITTPMLSPTTSSSLSPSDSTDQQLVRHPLVCDPSIPILAVYLTEEVNAQRGNPQSAYMVFGKLATALSTNMKFNPRFSNGNLNLTLEGSKMTWRAPTVSRSDLNQSLLVHLSFLFFKYIDPLFPMVIQ